MVATVTPVPVASAGPLMLPGNPRALPWSTVFPVLQRNGFKPSLVASNLFSFPHQSLHSLRTIWPPHSQKRQKIRLEHSKPPPSPIQLPHPCPVQIYLHPCPAFPTTTVEKGSSTWTLASSPSCCLRHLDVLVISISPLSLSPLRGVRLFCVLSNSTLSFKPSSFCPVLFHSFHLDPCPPPCDLLKESHVLLIPTSSPSTHFSPHHTPRSLPPPLCWGSLLLNTVDFFVLCVCSSLTWPPKRI